MKKLILPLWLLCSSLCGFAQVKFNVQVGLTQTSMTKSEDYKPEVGYRVGVGLEVPIDKRWSFQTALFFLNKSFSFEKNVVVGEFPFATGYDRINYLLDSKINALYLQLPLQVAVRIPVYKQYSVKISAGPYVACGVGGKSSTRVGRTFVENGNGQSDGSIVPDNDVQRNKVKTFSSNGLKRFDWGVALGADFEYKRWLAGVGFEYGLTPMATDVPKTTLGYLTGGDRTEVSPHHLGFNVHVGYSF